ncbi:hypothetical protein PBY51_010622 [Eleginops maclovinus]|uniref:Uncharacterized protein n=1 Tax=Eleginops maclovinus TaxID=56733 RepID=A0AAN7XAX3_ELEMC|nr:hypothetical protein PBY51_010622 [Eleginops maclovinus]
MCGGGDDDDDDDDDDGDVDDDDDDNDDDDDDCRLVVITAPPSHMSLLAQQMMGHLCLTGGNRHCWTFSDPSPNYTLRTWEEPIKKQPLGSVVSYRGSSVCMPVSYEAAVVLQT